MNPNRFLHVLLTAALLSLSLYGGAAVPSDIRKDTVNVTAPVLSKQDVMITKMRILANLSIAQYSALHGKKLNAFEKLSFRLSQKRMKMMLKKYDYGEVGTLQKISWLLKGLLLGPIAVAIAYIFLQDEERELIKWTWFGFAGFAAVILGILLFV